MKIACQTITFGARQKDMLPEVVETVSGIGYDALEIGFRHIQPTASERFKELLDKAGLQLAATHLGGNLEDTEQAAGEQQMIDTVMDYLKPLGTQLIMYSGLRFEDTAQFDKDLEMLNRAARRCAEHGYRLLYHNHHWEFADGERVIKALINDTDDALGFCPDVGWVDKAGVDVIEFLDRIKDRIGAMHFKDFATPDKKGDTVELGAGVVPLKEVVDWMQTKGLGDLWHIAEQDRSELSPEEAVSRNYHYLSALR